METITQDIAFLNAVAELTFTIKDLVMLFIIFTIPAVGAWGVIKFYFGWENDNKLDLKQYVFYPLVMVFLLANYSYFIDVTGSMVKIFVNAVGNDQSQYKRILEKGISQEGELTYEQAKEALKYSNPMIPFSGTKLGEHLGAISNVIVKTGKSAYGAVAATAKISYMALARSILETVRDIILSFIIVVGPLAIYFDIIPIFRGMFKRWIQLYISVLMWLVTLAIMDEFVIALDGVASGWNFFNNIVFILMYVMVPFLTTFYVGTEAAGIFMSKAVGAATWMAAKAVGAAAGGLTGGGGGAPGAGVK